jgi:hypothetical protein
MPIVFLLYCPDQYVPFCSRILEEAKEDEKLYDQLACWSETNDKGKTKSIADAQTRINDLRQE